MNAIEFNGVTKKYKLYKSDKKRFLSIFCKKIPHKEKIAVNNMSFSIKKGESVAIFGRNGAGKSTILKIITEVVYPSEGEVVVNGRVSALLELTAGFDGDLTGRQNIHLKGRILGLTKEEILEIEDSVITFAELEEYIDQPVRMYSSGMKARLGFSLNVHINPEILIVDEALSVGDREFSDKCLVKVRKLIEDQNTTLLFVTHSIPTAKKFCERGLVVEKGKLVFDGDIEKAVEIYSG